MRFAGKYRSRDGTVEIPDRRHEVYAPLLDARAVCVEPAQGIAGKRLKRLWVGLQPDTQPAGCSNAAVGLKPDPRREGCRAGDEDKQRLACLWPGRQAKARAWRFIFSTMA